MVDAMWFNDGALQRLPQVAWSVVAENEDSRVLRVRQEIIELLHARLTTDSEQAAIVLRLVKPESTEQCECVIQGAVHPWQCDESYSITSDATSRRITVEARTSYGLLHGFYALVRGLVIDDIALGRDHSCASKPQQSMRMIDQWDQIDGSVERGYAGESIFFGAMDSNSHDDFRYFPHRDVTNPFRGDITRITAYARYLASIGINAICLNNVNVRGMATNLIQQPFLSRVRDIAHIFESFGIDCFISINFASPKRLGGLDTADPCDGRVAQWWSSIADSIYRMIPQFGGFVVKADSEGEPGPMQYGRNHADGANMLAQALAPYGGMVIWRAFVYNSMQDWRDRSTDRAKAAYENFIDLDGQFADNVSLQIKFGPMDFQVREPLNPLLTAMKHTNLIMEFQITAEYLGHQIDVNYPCAQWRSMALQHTTVDTGEHSDDRVCALIRQRSKDATHTGFAAVSNVGMDDNWTGHALAQLNLYAFGRMCWDQELGEDAIAQEWLAQTYPDLHGEQYKRVLQLIMTSNHTYEQYTSPLGVGFMVTPAVHYGPSVDGYEFDRWGTYHFADREGIGVDRTVATGSGYTKQYPEALARQYEDLQSTPDELLLFFHHVPYTHVLHSGKTVIQHIYDTHFAGVEQVEEYCRVWDQVRGSVPESVWSNVHDRLQQQLANAINWRDQINTFFYRMSGIPDEQHRTVYA